MTLAMDYFARVRPLFGTGLANHVIAVDDAELALPVLELLASCMLEHVVVTDRATLPALDRYVAWKQPFAPLRHSQATPDAHIFTRRGAPSIAWRANTVTITLDPHDALATADLAYHAARGIRDALLGRAAWPARTPAQRSDPRGIAIDLRGKHVVVVGCGSLGSEALRLLAASGARFTLVDDADVSVYNLARQWFGAADVGRPKVEALQDRLDIARAWRTRLDTPDLPAFEALLRDDPADLVVLATGTHHHALLAELLWRRGIPHVAACCYPRARYFEVSIHAPREGTPCLHCFRGHLYRGAPDSPVPDELAAFLYAPVSDADRAQRYTDLVAEPASRIETLRAAQLLARVAVEMLSPARTPWFARVLAEETTCLLGGNTAGAYGITHPGQVIRIGTDDIIGSSDRVTCTVCDRTMQVTHRDVLPAMPDH